MRDVYNTTTFLILVKQLIITVAPNYGQNTDHPTMIIVNLPFIAWSYAQLRQEYFCMSAGTPSTQLSSCACSFPAVCTTAIFVPCVLHPLVRTPPVISRRCVFLNILTRSSHVISPPRLHTGTSLNVPRSQPAPASSGGHKFCLSDFRRL